MKQMSTEQRRTLSNILRKYTSFQTKIAIILCSLIPPYQSARCHISEDNKHRCENRKHRISGTYTRGAQNDLSLSVSCLAVLLWGGEKIRDKNIYRPETVLSMSAT
jgi:hypothetical protein